MLKRRAPRERDVRDHVLSGKIVERCAGDFMCFNEKIYIKCTFRAIHRERDPRTNEKENANGKNGQR